MMTRTRHLVLVAATALVASALTACMTPPDSHDYPDQVRSNFVESCVTQPGASEEMCGRCFEAVEKAYTYSEFVALDAAITAGTVSDDDMARFTEIITTCV